RVRWVVHPRDLGADVDVRAALAAKPLADHVGAVRHLGGRVGLAGFAIAIAVAVAVAVAGLTIAGLAVAPITVPWAGRHGPAGAELIIAELAGEQRQGQQRVAHERARQAHGRSVTPARLTWPWPGATRADRRS